MVTLSILDIKVRQLQSSEVTARDLIIKLREFPQKYLDQVNTAILSFLKQASTPNQIIEDQEHQYSQNQIE